MSINNQAAHYLEGLKLPNNWRVIRKVIKNNSLTGGYFSVSYIVEKDGLKAFLKALNIAAFFQLNNGVDLVDTIQTMTRAFQYERDLLLKCQNNNLSKIIRLYDYGQVNVPGKFFVNEVLT